MSLSESSPSVMAATLANWAETPMEAFAVIEDDPDNQFLIKTIPTTTSLDTKVHLKSFRTCLRRETDLVEPGPIPDDVQISGLTALSR